MLKYVVIYTISILTCAVTCAVTCGNLFSDRKRLMKYYTVKFNSSIPKKVYDFLEGVWEFFCFCID
jgi:hypothetical protein